MRRTVCLNTLFLFAPSILSLTYIYLLIILIYLLFLFFFFFVGGAIVVGMELLYKDEVQG